MKERWVYAAGVFDIMHYGHIKYLKRAKQLGDVLVVGLVDDQGVARYKHRLPMLSAVERGIVLRELKCVDHIVLQDDTDPTNTLIFLKQERGWIFDVMVRGDDYKGVPPGTRFIEENGGKVVRLPYSPEVSSTALKARLLNG